jgi:formylglycine-generating enzyme required for sulfatase activity
MATLSPARLFAMALAVLALESCWRGDPTSSSPAPKASDNAAASIPADRSNMVLIAAGEFPMGSGPADDVYPWEAPHEQPQHTVYLDAYYIDRTEVTNTAFERFDPKHERSPRSACDNCPVTAVAWNSAQAYCAAQQPPKRLPTEAEWEKAAKGGDPSGNPANLEEYAWFAKNSITTTQPVAQKRPNGYGLYDMLGNVREWTGDWYNPDYYRLQVRENPKGPAEGVQPAERGGAFPRRVERGGAFFLPRRGVTTTIRYNHPPVFRLYFLVFRCARDP